MALTLASLIVQETKEKIYEYGLAIATALNLPVSSWQPGDPTRSQFHLESETLAKLEEVNVGYIRSGFLDYAEGDWLKIGAKQVYNVDVPEATYATTSVILTNNGGGLYTLLPGDVTLKSTVTGKTYRSTTGGTLSPGPGTTLTITVVADLPGSSSSAGAGEINSLVTSLLGVTCSNPTAAIGLDDQDKSTTLAQCRDKLGNLSPNGPKEAYSYVARNRDLTGTAGVTRVRVYPDSTTGTVTIYLAGPSGGVSSPDRALVEAAILKWATPLCITPSVLSASNVVVPVTYELWLYNSANRTSAQAQAEILKALQTLFAARPIGGDIIPPALTGAVYQSLIESAIRAVYPQAFRVAVYAPAVDTPLGNGDVAVLGTVTGTINLIADP